MKRLLIEKYKNETIDKYGNEVKEFKLTKENLINYFLKCLKYVKTESEIIKTIDHGQGFRNSIYGNYPTTKIQINLKNIPKILLYKNPSNSSFENILYTEHISIIITEEEANFLFKKTQEFFDLLKKVKILNEQEEILNFLKK